ncbi:hypothetical protein [Vreelandella utahensis]|uniref:hypothetical protein n=1 Tax=Vreelandella halophila TaxID=86177 RepID=UPI0009846217|nr:hypothetical protein [Halomonas utahensis]
MFQLLNRQGLDRNDRDTEDDTTTINLERVGRTRIEDLVSSTREVPWTLTLAQLLWTAGPVTFLALQGGSLLGYGEPVELRTYLFFAIYVFIAAIIGVVARIMATTIRGRKQDKVRANITRTLDMIPDLIFTARDLHLGTLTKPERQRDAAAILLRKQDLGSNTISVAVYDLTNDNTLATIAEEIEVFRRAGMFSRIRDLNLRYEEHIEAALTQLKEYSGEIADLLRERLQGRAPNQDEGVERGDHFISQVYAAAHQEDLSLMTLEDVEDILGLAFELLSGREITRLTLDYEGDWQLARALDELERWHNAYRQVKASAVLYLRELAYFLIETRLTALDHSILDADTDTLLQETSNALTRLVGRLRWSGRNELETNRRAVRNLRMALRYAKLTRQAVGRLQDRYVRYVRALERWTLLRERLFENESLALPGEGLRIRESTIALNDEQKLEFAGQFVRYLDDHAIAPGNMGVLRHDSPMSIQHAKHLAIRVLLVLRPLIDLDNPSVQRALESSRGAFLEGLEMSFSADAKAGLGTAVVKELSDNLGPAAELIALRLTKLYRMPLSQKVRDFLVEHFDANPERLQFISDSARDDEQDEAPPIPHAPAMVHNYEEWRAPIEAAEGLLGQLLRQVDSN